MRRARRTAGFQSQSGRVRLPAAAPFCRLASRQNPRLQADNLQPQGFALGAVLGQFDSQLTFRILCSLHSMSSVPGACISEGGGLGISRWRGTTAGGLAQPAKIKIATSEAVEACLQGIA